MAARRARAGSLAQIDTIVMLMLELLETIPGVSRRIAEIIVSEIGVNMAVFQPPGVFRRGPASA